MTSPGIPSTSSPVASPTNSLRLCGFIAALRLSALLETRHPIQHLLLQHAVSALSGPACAILWPNGVSPRAYTSL